jgi:hypothetical protein
LFWLDKSQTSQHSFLSCLKQNWYIRINQWMYHGHFLPRTS